MPELPEVETVRRALEPHLIDAVIAGVDATVPSLRRPLDLPGLRRTTVGRRILCVRRRGKFLVAECSGARGLLLHLGMTGAFRICERHEPTEPYDRVLWDLADGRSWRLSDVRRFSIVEPCRLPEPGGWPEALHALGPEPLSPDFDAQTVYAATRRRTKPIKNLLLDQEFVAGVGNIYASEALFRARLDPRRPAASLNEEDCEMLVASLRTTLTEALAAGGTTISDFRSVDGSEGNFHRELHVYGRTGETCRRCGRDNAITRSVQSGRSTFFCPSCQR